MTELALRILTVLLGIPILLGWLWIAKEFQQFWLAVLLLTIVTALASWEYTQLIGQSGLWIDKISFTLVSVSTVVAYGALGSAHTLLIFTVGALIFLTMYLAHPEGMKDAAVAVLGLLYLPYFLHFFYAIYQPAHGFYVVLFLLVLVWAYDAGAYVVGTLLGVHKLFSPWSPKKSWEGVFGGWLLALLAGFVSLLWMPWKLSLPDAALHALAISVPISVAAQLGDLFESKLKRMANRKDSGAFFPGHGGMLDRIDSLLFALPVFYSYLHYVLKWV